MVGLGNSVHPMTREEHGKQEKLEASSMEGARAAAMVWRRARACFGGSVHRRNYGNVAPAVGSEGGGENGTYGLCTFS